MRFASSIAGFVASFCVLVISACGDEPCPAGTVAAGDRCVPVDGGAGDGGDAGDADASDAAEDACASNAEECNGLDDDCDGTLDEGLALSAFYADTDADTYGDDEASVMACAAPPMHVARAGDCDDTNAAVQPGAAETCDDADEDCDGAIDEGRVGPVGAPVSLGEIANATTSRYDVAIAADSTGYSVAYFSTAEQVVYDRLTPAGAWVAGSLRALHDGDEDDLREISVVVVDAGGAETALVAYYEASSAHASSVRVDGSTSTSPQLVAAGGPFLPRLGAAGDEVVLGYLGDSGREVSARSVNAGSGAPLGDPRALHSWLSAFHGPAYFAGMSSPELLLMGMSDQLAGDTVVTGYLGAFRVGGTPVPIGELVEAQPDEALAATAVMPIENGEGASAVLVHTRDASQELSVAPVTLSSTASPTVGTFSEYASGPGPYVASSAGRNVHVVFNDFGETSYLHGEVPIGATTGGGLSPIITTSPYSVHGVSIAMRSSTEGAILYAVKAGSGRPHPEMFFQRIACE